MRLSSVPPRKRHLARKLSGRSGRRKSASGRRRLLARSGSVRRRSRRSARLVNAKPRRRNAETRRSETVRPKPRPRRIASPRRQRTRLRRSDKPRQKRSVPSASVAMRLLVVIARLQSRRSSLLLSKLPVKRLLLIRLPLTREPQTRRLPEALSVLLLERRARLRQLLHLPLARTAQLRRLLHLHSCHLPRLLEVPDLPRHRVGPPRRPRHTVASSSPCLPCLTVVQPNLQALLQAAMAGHRVSQVNHQSLHRATAKCSSPARLAVLSAALHQPAFPATPVSQTHSTASSLVPLWA